MFTVYYALGITHEAKTLEEAGRLIADKIGYGKPYKVEDDKGNRYEISGIVVILAKIA